MAHSEPFTPGSRQATPAPRARGSTKPDSASGSADEALDINALLEQEDLADPALRLLVITLDAATPAMDPERECVICVSPGATPKDSESQPAARRLPVAGNAFDVVVGYRLVRPGCDAIPLLREALRVLREDGSMVLVTDPRDFALLPPQGPAHLAHRSLTGAGIHGARFTQYGATSVAVLRKGHARD